VPSQARLSDKAKGICVHGCNACPHSVKGPAVSGSNDVFVNGRPAFRKGDPGIHMVCCTTNSWKAFTGSATVYINGKSAARKGDVSKHCGGFGQITDGSSDVHSGG